MGLYGPGKCRALCSDAAGTCIPRCPHYQPRHRALEPSSRLWAVWLLVTLLLSLTALGGCAATQNGAPILAGGFGVVCGILLLGAVMLCAWGDWKAVLCLLLAAAMLALGGCAALPMPLQPGSTSTRAEGAFIVLDIVDTLQTVQIAKHHNCLRESDPVAAWMYGSKYPNPSRVAVTNIAFIVVHTMVTSWLDDEVGAHPDSPGWIAGRRTWLAVSLVYSGYSVARNFSAGIGPTNVTSSECR